MTRTTHVVLTALVVLAALVGGVGHVGATADSQVGATTGGLAAAGAAPSANAAVAQEDCSFPVTLTDASGTEVTLEEEPETVVTLGASSAQTVWEIGEQEKVVGMPVDSSTAYLNGSDNRTHVLDGINVDLEVVTDLDPDLVIAPNIIASEDVQALRDAGHTVYRENDASSVADIRERTETTGRLLGACGAADDTIEWMNETLSTVEETVADEDRPSVFYWLGSGFTATPGSFQDEGITLAGATNAAANIDLGQPPQAEPEEIVAEDPDYFLVTEGGSLPEDHPVQQTTAAQEGDVLTVDSNYWNQPAPRFVLAIQQVSEQLHSEAYAESGENGTDGDSVDDGASDPDGSADDGEPNASDDGGDDGSPGFGVPVAIVALLGAVFALRQRE
ncbi:PGF-CTERM-anchored ABC transporter substrate-binding protein [Salinarchaeum chitinilyticum]